jgi:hypothetical protein
MVSCLSKAAAPPPYFLLIIVLFSPLYYTRTHKDIYIPTQAGLVNDLWHYDTVSRQVYCVLLCLCSCFLCIHAHTVPEVTIQASIFLQYTGIYIYTYIYIYIIVMAMINICIHINVFYTAVGPMLPALVPHHWRSVHQLLLWRAAGRESRYGVCPCLRRRRRRRRRQ